MFISTVSPDFIQSVFTPLTGHGSLIAIILTGKLLQSVWRGSMVTHNDKAQRVHRCCRWLYHELGVAMEWISTKDRLPEEGKYVLARHNRGTWHDSSDQENVSCVVVKLVRGISETDRQRMKSGELPEHPPERGWCLSAGWKDSPRSRVYKSEDEHGNNLVPYIWQQFGTDSFFGQTITHWAEIPPMQPE